MHPFTPAHANSREADADRPGGADDAAWAETYRRQLEEFARLAGPPEPILRVDDLTASGPGGTVRLRLYRPCEGLLPVLLFLHGGGFVGGTLDTHEAPLRALANRSGWAVMAVEYRLAPEHPFPAAPEDCFAALRYLAEGGVALGINPERIAVGGESAGGNLALAAALLARERGGPKLRLLTLLYPNVDLRADPPHESLRANDGRILEMATVRRAVALYVPDPADRENPLASPLLADLSGLPPALVVTCGLDPLHDEGVALVARLQAEGVRVRHRNWRSMVHGFFQMATRVPATQRLFDELAAALREAAEPG